MVDELAPLHKHEGPAPVRGQPVAGEVHNQVGDSPDLVGRYGPGLIIPTRCWTNPDPEGAGPLPELTLFLLPSSLLSLEMQPLGEAVILRRMVLT